MKQIIEHSLNRSMSYNQYIDLMKTLTEKNASTGFEQSELLSNYTALNHRRMTRWDKKLSIGDSQQQAIKNFQKPVIWLVITESWCGDAAHVMPVINKVAQLNDNINLRVVLRDENSELMDLFLTDGARSIPKLIVLDADTKKILASYGPRPSVVMQMVKDYKKQYGKLTAEFKEDLQLWYNKDKGQSTIKDLVALLSVETNALI